MIQGAISRRLSFSWPREVLRPPAVMEPSVCVPAPSAVGSRSTVAACAGAHRNASPTTTTGPSPPGDHHRHAGSAGQRRGVLAGCRLTRLPLSVDEGARSLSSATSAASSRSLSSLAARLISSRSRISARTRATRSSASRRSLSPKAASRRTESRRYGGSDSPGWARSSRRSSRWPARHPRLGVRRRAADGGDKVLPPVGQGDDARAARFEGVIEANVPARARRWSSR